MDDDEKLPETTGARSDAGMRRIPRRILAWLAANFVANGMLVYGLVRHLDGKEAIPILLLGAAASLVCMLVLARPQTLNAAGTPGRRDHGA